MVIYLWSALSAEHSPVKADKSRTVGTPLYVHEL